MTILLIALRDLAEMMVMVHIFFKLYKLYENLKVF